MGFWAILLVVLLALLEATSYAIEQLSPRLLQEPIRRRGAILRDQSQRIATLLDTTRHSREMLDSLLGWRYRSGYSSESDHINSQGLRSRHEYAPQPPRNKLRVAAFGDSFVYGNEVADDEAWASVIDQTSGDIEILNYGVGGYGLDQALLRYQSEGGQLKPDLVMIGFTSDDLRRIVNVYRRFISILEQPLTKPRFVLSPDRQVALIGNPLPHRADYERLRANPLEVRKLGAFDEWYSPTIYENPLYDYVATLRVGHALTLRLFRRFFDPHRLVRNGIFNERSRAFAVQVAVLERFAARVKDAGALAIIVMLPERGSVERARAGAPTLYAPLQRALDGAGIEVWDAAEAFQHVPDSLDSYFAPGGHYSARGNRAVATWLVPRLESLRAARLARRVSSR